MKPRASASFCHWPKLTSTPSGQVGPSCVSSPAASRATTSSAPARSTAATTAGSSSSRGHVADAHGLPRPELEPEEILERAGEPRPPRLGGHARQLDPVHQDAAARRLIQPAQELHERGLAGAVLAHDGHHRAGLEVQADVLEHQALRAGIGEGHVLEANPVGEPLRHRRIGSARPARPRSPRARPGASSRRARSRAGSRSRPPWRRCTPTAASRPPAPAARCPASRGPRARRTPRRRRTRRRRPPTPACATGRSPSAPRPRARTTRSHAARRRGRQAIADAGDAHLLAGRGRRGRRRTGAAPAGSPARPAPRRRAPRPAATRR